MALSTELTQDVNKTLQQKLDGIEFYQEQIVIVDDEKSLYDQGIVQLETQVFDAQEDVNNAFGDVQGAYQERINVGCRTDMFWRVTGINTSTPPTTYDLKCTKLNPGGYEYLSFDSNNVGIGSTVRFLNSDGTIADYPINSNWADTIGDPGGAWFGLGNRHLYGVKYYQQPYGVDIGATFVTSFIGSIAAGSNKLTVMNPLPEADVGAGVTVYEVGQIVIANGIFGSTTKITGVGTGYADLSRINSIVGIGSTVSLVNILTLDIPAAAPATAPMDTGDFQSFKIIDDPDTLEDTGRRKYEVTFGTNPFDPETIGIATTGSIGIGVSIYSNSSGDPSASQSWDRMFEGIDPISGDDKETTGEEIQEPVVGAGRIFYSVGFTSAPTAAGGSTPTAENTTLTGITAAQLSTMYNLDLSSNCTAAIESAITDAIGVSSTKETALISDDGIVQLKLDASRGLRQERNEYSLRIWGMRNCINEENNEMDRLESLRNYIGLGTIVDALG